MTPIEQKRDSPTLPGATSAGTFVTCIVLAIVLALHCFDKDNKIGVY